MPVYVTRRVKGWEGEHAVYTAEEAAALGIEARPWQDVDVTEWALSDDGYVVQCFRVQTYRGTASKRWTSAQLTFSVGRVWVSFRVDEETGRIVRKGSGQFLVGAYLREGSPWASSPGKWSDHTARRTSAKQAARLYAFLWIVRGGSLTTKDWDMIGLAYRPDDKIPRATARVFFKTEAAQKLVRGYWAELLGVNDMTQEQVLAMYREQLRLAQEQAKGGNTTALKHGTEIVDRFAKITGLTGDDVAPLAGMLERGGADDYLADWSEPAQLEAAPGDALAGGALAGEAADDETVDYEVVDEGDE